jgi:hypothetical protein
LLGDVINSSLTEPREQLFHAGSQESPHLIRCIFLQSDIPPPYGFIWTFLLIKTPACSTHIQLYDLASIVSILFVP